jgi:hypothetical protein
MIGEQIWNNGNNLSLEAGGDNIPITAAERII